MRSAKGEIVVEGPKQVLDAVAHDLDPIVILAAESAPLLEEIEAVVISDDLARWLSGTRTPQGIFGLFSRPGYELGDLLDARRLIVALDEVQDPGNAGTIVRLASAFGVSGVVGLEGTADFWSQRAIRASVGEILRVRTVSSSTEELLALAERESLPLWCADGRGERVVPPGSGAIIVFGSEGRGVSRELVSRGRSFSIGMSEQVDSLNVASAAAIVLHTLWENAR